MLAPIPEPLKDAFRTYWQQRCEREARKLHTLLGFASTGSTTAAGAAKHLRDALSCDHRDVADLLAEVVTAGTRTADRPLNLLAAFFSNPIDGKETDRA
jgi:hypothetical protein